jgi:DNA repair protein RadC
MKGVKCMINTKTSINVYRLKMVRESSEVYEAAIKDPGTAYRMALDILELGEAAEENFCIICLNTKNKVVGLHTISIGSLNSSIVHPREVFKAACLNNASAIILLHNHPSGEPEPSHEDIETTQRLVSAGNIMGIKVLDHVIVGYGKYISMKEQGLM